MKVQAVYAVITTNYSGYDSDPTPGIPTRHIVKRTLLCRINHDDVVGGYVVGRPELFRMETVIKRSAYGRVNYRREYEFIYAMVPSTPAGVADDSEDAESEYDLEDDS